jgi:hypothetical protein
VRLRLQLQVQPLQLLKKPAWTQTCMPLTFVPLLVVVQKEAISAMAHDHVRAWLLGYLLLLFTAANQWIALCVLTFESELFRLYIPCGLVTGKGNRCEVHKLFVTFYACMCCDTNCNLVCLYVPVSVLLLLLG